MIAEIYPPTDPRAGDERATTANWGANFLVTISFRALVNTITP
jgi:hypothetical protein